VSWSVQASQCRAGRERMLPASMATDSTAATADKAFRGGMQAQFMLRWMHAAAHACNCARKRECTRQRMSSRRRAALTAAGPVAPANSSRRSSSGSSCNVSRGSPARGGAALAEVPPPPPPVRRQGGQGTSDHVTGRPSGHASSAAQRASYSPRLEGSAACVSV
jgi:hypothetical protein